MHLDLSDMVVVDLKENKKRKKVGKTEKIKTYSSQYSLVVTHPTTNWSLHRLSWLIGREAD